MRIFAALLLLLVSSAAFAQHAPLTTELQTRQTDTYKEVRVPNGSILGIKLHRTVIGEVRAVPRQFQSATADGVPCIVIAYVREDNPVLNDAQRAEVSPDCEKAERFLSQEQAARAAELAAEAKVKPMQYQGDPDAGRAILAITGPTAVDVAKMTPQQIQQMRCDDIRQTIRVQLDLEAAGSSGYYNLQALRQAERAACAGLPNP